MNRQWGTAQVEVAKHMSRGLLSLVPIFAGCSSPFLDSLSVLLHEVTSQAPGRC